MALSLNPESEEALNARSECSLEHGDKAQNIKSDGLLGSEEGRNMNSAAESTRLQMIESTTADSDPEVRAGGLVLLGYQYLKGEGYPMNKEKATELFLEAAELGSPDGAFNSGISYIRGIGVKENILEAIKWFRVAAKHPVKPGFEHDINNIAIARAKESLGEIHENGDGESGDYAQAAKWYAQAAVEGRGQAANKLAHIYHYGWGFPPDLKLALQYQRLAVDLGPPLETMGVGDYLCYLGILYASMGDLPQARHCFTRAAQHGHSVDTLDPQRRRGIEALLQRQQQKFDEFQSKLPQTVLDSKLPIHVLYERQYAGLRRGVEDVGKMYFRELPEVLSNPANYENGSENKDGAAVDTAEVERVSTAGQEYARVLLTALGRVKASVKTIQMLFGPKADKRDEPAAAAAVPKEELKKSALAHFAAYYFAGQVNLLDSVSAPKECRAKLVAIAKEFISDGKKSESDLHARVVLISLNAGFEAFGGRLKFATQCRSRYPKEPSFFEYLARAKGSLVSPEEGIKVAEEGLKLFPDNADLLYARAVLLRTSWVPKLKNGEWEVGVEDFFKKEPPPSEGEPIREAMLRWLGAACGPAYDKPIEAYQEFVRKAPSGHQKVPDGYFWISTLSAAAGKIQEVEINYTLGVEAEKKLLSGFQGCASISKKLAQECLKIIEETKDSTKYPALSRTFFQIFLEEDPAEAEENRKLKISNPKRTATFKHFRRVFLTWDEDEQLRVNVTLMSKLMLRPGKSDVSTTPRKQIQRAPSPSQIPSLKDICFEDMNTTIDWIYDGRAMNLTIMEEYIDGVKDPIHSVVKDDNDDFNIISFYGFDRTDPSTKKKFGFGSRIRLMNPFFRRSQEGGPMIRVDDPSSVEFFSMGIDNPLCRYCWKPDPSPRCSKCKTAQYCSKECQRLDWVVLNHKELCNIISKQQQTVSE